MKLPKHSAMIKTLKIFPSHISILFLLADFNYDTLGVAFVGDFEVSPSSEIAIGAELTLFEDAMILGKISQHYVIYAAVDQIEIQSPTSLGPGEAFMEIIRTWEKYLSQKRFNLT